MQTNTQTNYTPGPWTVRDNTATPYGQLLVESENDGAVALCYTVERGEYAAPLECVANARLIASAPELLACLLDVLDADGDLDVMDFDRYRAAIAKATT